MYNKKIDLDSMPAFERGNVISDIELAARHIAFALERMEKYEIDELISKATDDDRLHDITKALQFLSIDCNSMWEKAKYKLYCDIII